MHIIKQLFLLTFGPYLLSFRNLWQAVALWRGGRWKRGCRAYKSSLSLLPLSLASLPLHLKWARGTRIKEQDRWRRQQQPPAGLTLPFLPYLPLSFATLLMAGVEMDRQLPAVSLPCIPHSPSHCLPAPSEEERHGETGCGSHPSLMPCFSSTPSSISLSSSRPLAFMAAHESLAAASPHHHLPPPASYLFPPSPSLSSHNLLSLSFSKWRKGSW